MLVHIGQTEAAERAHNAWLKTIEDGVHTYDIFDESVSKQKVGTKEFAQAVADRVGQVPSALKAVSYAKTPKSSMTERPVYVRSTEKRELVGADVFIEFIKGGPNDLAALLLPLEGDGLKLEMLSNRGMAVWPKGLAETFCVDVFRCRFKLPDASSGHVQHGQVLALMDRILKAGLEFVKMEGLYNFDGKPGFSRGQGQ